MNIVFHTTLYSPEELDSILCNLLYYLNHEIDCSVQSCENCRFNELCTDVVWYIPFDPKDLHELSTDSLIFNLDNYTVAGLLKLRKALRNLNTHIGCDVTGDPCDLCRNKLLCDDTIAALDVIRIYMDGIRKGDHNDSE